MIDLIAATPGVAYRLGFGIGGVLLGLLFAGVLISEYEEAFTHPFSFIATIGLTICFLGIGVAALLGQRLW